ncbi:hypothetical protein [Lysobacter claricitrinus]|uniref:hypothetical protein n=1 Tax=Lysobacter claricitrinus TaxID=3367728 RepID=UPI0037DB9E72
MKQLRQKILSAVLVVVLATTASSPRYAQATGLPVVDISAIMTAIMSQMNDIAQYAKEVQGMATDVAHYQAVMDHYRQQLIRLQRMASSLSFSGTQPLQKVPDDYMVDTMCQSSHGGLDLRSLLSSFRLNPKGDLIQQQRTICELRQVARNQKFNETIDFLTRVKEETQTELSQMASRQDSGGETQAAVQTSTNDAMASSVRLSAIYQNYSSKVQMYDTQIASLDDMQKTLATAALKGENNPIGTLVKTATLETALKVH